MQFVVFLQTKFPLEKSETERLVARWTMYRKFLENLLPGSNIILFTPKPSIREVDEVLYEAQIRRFSEIEDYKSAFFRLLHFFLLMRRSSAVFTIVLSNDQRSLVYGVILKLFNGRNIQLQSQFHGATYSLTKNEGLRGFFRVSLARTLIQISDSIRIVSRFQEEEILSFSPKSIGKFVVAPIPVDFSRVAEPNYNKTIQICFVGRLHSERGVKEMILIIQELFSSGFDGNISIAGSGPMRKDIEFELRREILRGSVKLLGHLNPIELRDLFFQSRILLSTAPSEGYGLTIREAALSSVCVIARSCKGTLIAREDYPGLVITYETKREAIELITRELASEVRGGCSEFQIIQKAKDAESLQKLVKSWVQINS